LEAQSGEKINGPHKNAPAQENSVNFRNRNPTNLGIADGLINCVVLEKIYVS